MVTTTETVIDPIIMAQNVVPGGENAAENSVSGATPATLSCLKLLLLFVLVFTIVLC